MTDCNVNVQMKSKIMMRHSNHFAVISVRCIYSVCTANILHAVPSYMPFMLTAKKHNVAMWWTCRNFKIFHKILKIFWILWKMSLTKFYFKPVEFMIMRRNVDNMHFMTCVWECKQFNFYLKQVKPFSFIIHARWHIQKC